MATRSTANPSGAAPNNRGDAAKSTPPRKRARRAAAKPGAAELGVDPAVSPAAAVGEEAAPASPAAAEPPDTAAVPTEESAVPVPSPSSAAPARPAVPGLHRPKLKLVRDSFTMPQADFALIQLLKDRALEVERPAKKSELLRAGLHALALLDASDIKQALDKLEPLKAGRPKKIV